MSKYAIPFMIRYSPPSFPDCRVGQSLVIEGKPMKVSKIISVESVHQGEYIQVVGLCKEGIRNDPT